MSSTKILSRDSSFAPRETSCYAARIASLSQVWATVGQSQQLGIMIVEEPSSQERWIGDDELVLQ